MATLGTNFPYTIPPLTNISPFTYRDGGTYLEILYALKNYINENLRTEFNENFNTLLAELQVGITNAETAITDLGAQWTADYNAFIANFTNEIAVLSAAAVTGMIEDPGTVRAALLTLIDTEIAATPIDDTELGTLLAADSAAGAALDARALVPVNVKQFGAVGDNTADDTAALVAAAAAATAAGATLTIPRGTYKTSGTVTFTHGVDAAADAYLYYHGSGVAVVLGVDTSGAVTARKEFRLPHIIKVGGTSWDGTSYGVRAVNLNACKVFAPFIQNFEVGLYTIGRGHGHAYTDFFIGALWGNHKNLYLDQDDTGWNNSNNFFGGRFAQNSAWNGVDDPDAVQVYMVAPASATFGNPNANTFVGCSFESDGQYYYRVVLGGWYNAFINCRWENTTGAANSMPRVLYKAGAALNRISGGYDAAKIVETFEGTLIGNSIQDGVRIYCKANHVTGQAIPHNVTTKLVEWSSFLGFRATYDPATSEIRPRPGRWTVRASVSFAADPTATGHRQAVLKSGSTVLDLVRLDGSAQIQTLKLSGTHVFNGADTLYVEVLQTSGADLPLVTTVNFNKIEADYNPS